MTIDERPDEDIDYKQKYYSTLENQVLFKEKQNKKLAERIRRLTNGTEVSDMSPIHEYSAYDEASEGLNSLLPPSLSGDHTGDHTADPDMFKDWNSSGVFDMTINGKPRKRARKKCRDCNQDDCKGPTSGPFGKLLCAVWVANNPEKVIKYQEKLKEMKKVG